MGCCRWTGSLDYITNPRTSEYPTFVDGVALIISTQAVQIFDVLRSIGGQHSFSAGLVIGGKSLKDESDRLSRMNILVATPGRLLQHMDQTVGFDASNLQILGKLSLTILSLCRYTHSLFPSPRRGRSNIGHGLSTNPHCTS